MVIITHAMWVAAEHARRVVVMAGGRVLARRPARGRSSTAPTCSPAAALRPPGAAALAAPLGSRAVSVAGILAGLARG